MSSSARREFLRTVSQGAACATIGGWHSAIGAIEADRPLDKPQAGDEGGAKSSAARPMRAADFPQPRGWPNVFSPEGHGLAIEDVWPSLYIGADRVSEIAGKARRLPWAAAVLERWKIEAETVLEEEPAFVPGPTGGRTDMYAEGDGQHYLFDPSQNQRMWDPLHRRYVKPTERNLAAWRVLCHERIRRLMTSLGFLYRLTGDDRYSRWVWKGLDNSVRQLFAPEHRPQQLKEKRYGVVYGGLYDAQAVMQLVQAAELVADAPGADKEIRQAVQQHIFTAVGEALSAWMDVMIVHNMSCWSMSALAQLARVCGRKEWLEKALHSKRTGLVEMLRTGVPRDAKTGEVDGFWHETATFYGIFYALTSLIPLYRIGEAQGIVNAELREHFAAMFEAPLALCDEQLRMLAVGDRVGPGFLRLTQARHLYEYAAGQVDSQRYGPVLAMLYQHCGADRSSLAALAWGPDGLPAPARPPSQSVVLPGAKMVTFRRATERGPVTCWFLAGQDTHSGQAHHHHDKLSLSLHAFGRIVTSDLGLPGRQDNDWERFLNSTFSHNTLMIDERAQGPMKSLRFEADLKAAVPWAAATVQGDRSEGGRKSLWRVMETQRRDEVTAGLYDGVKLSRDVYFDIPYLVVCDEGEMPQQRRFEFVFHAYGSMVVDTRSAAAAPLKLPPLPTVGGFGLFTERTTADPAESITVDWRIWPDLWLRLVSVGDGPLEATWGTTPGNPREQTRGTVLLRAPGTRRRYASVLELHSGQPTVRTIGLKGREGAELILADGARRIYGRA